MSLWLNSRLLHPPVKECQATRSPPENNADKNLLKIKHSDDTNCTKYPGFPVYDRIRYSGCGNIYRKNQNESREYYHGSNGIWGRVEKFDFTVFGFRCRSFLEGISMAFDGSENLQEGPLSTQIPLPRSMVEHGRIGIPGNFRVRVFRLNINQKFHHH